MDRQEWESLIIENPCQINLADRLSQVITEMGQVGIACELDSNASSRSLFSCQQPLLQSSYAVVLDAEQVIGVLTAQEIVGWLSTPVFNEDCQLNRGCINAVLPLTESDLTTQIVAIHLLLQRKAACLPIVDAQNQCIGLLTTESVARFSQPLAPLRLQTVGDVMQAAPTLVTGDCSMGAIAQQMAQQKTRFVVLPIEGNDLITNPKSKPSWGIIRDQDIVQLLALDVDLNRVPTATIVQPIATISAAETLWSAYQQIDQQGGYPLAVTSAQGHLVGLLSLDDLLRAFDPLVLYQLSESCAVKLAASEPIAPPLQSAPPANPSPSISGSISYQSFMAASPVGILRTNTAGICTYVNDRYCEILGLEQTALIGQPWSVGYRPEDLERMVAQYEMVRRENRPWSIEYQVQRPDGSEVWVYGQAVVEYNSEGQEIGFVGTITDISDRKRSEILLESQHKVLERIAKGEPLPDILNALLQTTEFHLPGTLCSILLCEQGHLYCLAAPSLSQDYCAAVDGILIGEGVGSCGTAAARREVVIVSDIATDPLWQNYQHLALTHNLRACCSAPILGIEETVLGVFGIYYQEQRVPQPQEIERLRQSANIAGIAIERSQATQAITQLNQELERRVQERTAALSASQAQYQRLTENIPGVIYRYVLYPDGRDAFTHVGSRLRDIFELDPEEALQDSQNLWAKVCPEDVFDLQVLTAQSAQTLQHCNKEFRVILSSGASKWVQSISLPEKHSDASVSWDGIFFDITSRKNTELGLKDSERRYASLAAAAPVAIFRFDSQLNCVYVNERWSEMTGRPAESALGQGWIEALHPDDREAAIANWREIDAQDTGLDVSQPVEGAEGRHLRPDGTVNWFYVRIAREFDDSGNIVGYVGTLTDITERKMAELALQESQAQFHRMTENVPGMIYRYVLHADGSQGFTYISPQVREIYEVEADEVIQNPEIIWARIHPDDVLLHQAKVLESAANLTPAVLEHRLITPSGLKFVKATTACPERQHDGSICWDGVVIDLTDRKMAELALQESQAQFHHMTENVPGMIYRYVLHPDGTDEVTYVSSQVREVFEVEPATALQDIAHIWARIHPDDIPWLGDTIRVSAETLQPFTSTYRLLLPHKGLRWVQNMSHAERLENCDVVWDGIVVDISDRKQTEQQLQELSERLELAIQSAQIGIWEYDFGSGRLTWDDRMYAIYGVKPEDFKGIHQDWENCVHPDDLAQASADLVDDTNRFIKEFRIVHPNGSIRHVFSSALRQRDKQGRLTRCVGVNLDITERKQAEQQLEELSKRLELATQSAQLGIWEWDAQCDRFTFNDQMFVIYGLTPETFGGTYQDWVKQIHPDDLAKAQPTLIPEQDLYTKEFRIIRPDGQICYLLASSLTQRNDRGDLVRIIGTNLDISDRKQAELALEQEVLHRSTIFNASSDGIHILDSDVNLLEANSRFFQMLGYTPEEASHFNVSDWDAQLTREEVKSNLQNFPWDTSRIRKVETLHRRKDGSIFPVEIYICRMEWDGQLSFICVARDISERKQAEAQLRRTNEELLRATRLKDEFLANMSHELRTPLNAILGMSEALQDQMFGLLNERQLKMVRTVEKSGEHLLSLINDILDVAKIESGQIELEYTPVNVSQLCQSSLTFIKQQAFKKGIQLNIQLPTSPLPDLYLDDRRIRQVLINLLNNAVKFTPEGGYITLRVIAPWESQDLNGKISSKCPMLQVSVTDTGIGIAQENISKLFQPFVQIDGALNRKYTGTGLGLALVKRIVELHEGEVHLTSELGVGSCFFVTLPYRPSETIAETESKNSVNEAQFTNKLNETSLTVKSANDLRMKILLAEDNEANIRVVADYLEVMGYGVTVAHNGQEAIKLVQSLQPDLILMDIQMPGMDGLEAIQKIREIPDFRNIPIIALTALAMPGDEARCLNSGATDYISKPIRLKNLHAKIKSYLTSTP